MFYRTAFLSLLVLMQPGYFIPAANASYTRTAGGPDIQRDLSTIDAASDALGEFFESSHSKRGPPGRFARTKSNNPNVPRNTHKESLAIKALESYFGLVGNAVIMLECGIGYFTFVGLDDAPPPKCSRAGAFTATLEDKHAKAVRILNDKGLLTRSFTNLTDTTPVAFLSLNYAHPLQKENYIRDIVALDEEFDYNVYSSCRQSGNCITPSATQKVAQPTSLPRPILIRFYLDQRRKYSLSNSLAVRDALPQIPDPSPFPTPVSYVFPSPSPTPVSYVSPSPTQLSDEEIELTVYSVVEDVFQEEWQKIYDMINAGSVRTIPASALTRASKAMDIEGPFENEYIQVRYMTQGEFKSVVGAAFASLQTLYLI
ncbi:hypothetical protein TWF718_006174 [Orbilia javanica]|uniref:Uncharacterized protein n=1 Tax=Orbilia javanica TaxID=47235 RepID=A0AAN8MVZ0_9PEZI